MAAPPPSKRPRMHVADVAPFDGEEEALRCVEGLFETYGRDPMFEIEARIKDVSQHQFTYIMHKLDASKDFVKTRTKTTDYAFDQLRVQQYESGEKKYMTKNRECGPHDYNMYGTDVRISVAAEVVVGPPSTPQVPDSVRLKDRCSYNYKSEVLFELTMVRSGRTLKDAHTADTIFEVELEWCGQSKPFEKWDAPDRARSFFAKVKDMVRFKNDADKKHSAPPASAAVWAPES